MRRAIAALALLALGACASDGAQAVGANPTPLTPTERYSIEVEPHPVELKLAVHAQGLSPAQRAALGDFVQRWTDADRKAILIKAPTHGPDPAAAYRTAAETRAFLIGAGAAPDEVRVAGYDADGDRDAPVTVGFIAYAAKGPDCGRAWTNVASVRSNEAYPEFGCAITANIAAQIADPADLLRPRAETPPDAERRQTVIDKYRLGQPTSTAKDSQAQASPAAGTQ
ncbi:MAG: CpaD family pilus assembly protein [Caulobacteraceae bacterium]